MEKKLEVYYSDDYAGASNGDLDFYYGYEHTICKEHGEGGPPKGYQCECDDREWCFVVSREKKWIATYTKSELEAAHTYASPELSRDEPYAYLLLGIMKYLSASPTKKN